MRARTRRWLVGAPLALALVFGSAAYLLAPGARFLATFMDPTPCPDIYTMKDLTTVDGVPVRVYTPKGGHDGVIVLVHGVHHDGYDESRLVHFALTLVRMGYQVATPDVADLRRYDITPDALHDIERAARWALEALAPEGGRIGLWGISFAGGLCLRAAATEGLRGKISSAFSFGGHGDMSATLEYLMTGETPDGPLPPHVYGQAVLVKRAADRLVPEVQAAPLRALVYRYLQGESDEAEEAAKALPPESRAYTDLIFKRDVAALGALLEEKIGAPEIPEALSATRGPAPGCSVHLLHGAVDNVIPPSELDRLARWAEEGGVEVNALVSPLISHVELDDEQAGAWLNYLKIIRFWARLLRAT